ncbi:MAG TPA: hypothetical protein VJ276_14765 [Thermoanaerobaculia bacterium]|nr:hypothetical protein [Thermoanaerobaculia bacterium]
MRRQDLLPGVSDAECPPVAVIESRVAIRRARRKAALHDGLQLVLLAAVDYLVLRHPLAHIPTFDRQESMVLLGAVNGAMLGWLWLARVLPCWKARRIAATWSRGEQSRFSGTLRRP